MKIPLIGVPRHLWRMVTNLFSASPGLILWRVFLILAAVIGVAVIISATGGSGILGIFVVFILTTLLSAILRDDILAVWRDLWNARWGEVTV